MRISILAAAAVAALLAVPRSAHARYLMAQNANFLQPDRLDAHDGANLYAYVQDNPTTLTDPMGTTPWGYSMVSTSDPTTRSMLQAQANEAFIKAIEFEGEDAQIPIYEHGGSGVSGPLQLVTIVDWNAIGFTPIPS